MNYRATLSLERARDFLLAESEGGFKGAWDCATGFRGAPLLIGTVFQISFLALTLSRPELGSPEGLAVARREAESIADLGSDDGWRYFNLYPGIPPDTDDLAQVIRLFMALDLPERDRLLESPLQLLKRNFHPEGGCYTWMLEDPSRALEVCQTWMPGDDPRHPEVVANLLEALCRYAPDAFRDELERGAEYLLTCQEPEGWASYNYFGWGYGTMVTVKALRALADVLPDMAPRLSEAAQKAGLSLLSAQAPDGGWAPRRPSVASPDPRDGSQVSPQETAFVLEALTTLDGWVSGPWREAMPSAVTAILEHQAADGSWPGEPFYFTLGRLPYQSRELTTSHCLHSLLSALALLPPHGTDA